jgi:hypothetical protein
MRMVKMSREQSAQALVFGNGIPSVFTGWSGSAYRTWDIVFVSSLCVD